MVAKLDLANDACRFRVAGGIDIAVGCVSVGDSEHCPIHGTHLVGSIPLIVPDDFQMVEF